MSFTPEEERPKLKAKRFSKFESSARISVADTLNDTGQERQRFKRKNEETFSQEIAQPKRKCSEFITQPSVTKNLANNRLQKLKEYLKSDLNQDSKYSAHSPENNITRQVGSSPIQENKRFTSVHPECNKNDYTNLPYKIPLLKSPSNENNSTRQVGSSPIQENKLFSTSVYPQTSKNIYTNLNKWASPSINTPVKNIFHCESNGKSQNFFDHSILERHRPAQEKHDPSSTSTHKDKQFEKSTSFAFDTPSKKSDSFDNDRISQSRSNYNMQDGQQGCSPLYRYPNNYNRDPQNRPSHTKPDEHGTTQIKQVATEVIGNNIYKNLDKWASPPDGTPQKNLANSRLQRLKNVVKNLKPNASDLASPYTPEKTPDTFNSEQNHCSPLLRDKNTAMKRNRTESDSTPESTPPKRIMINPFSSGLSTHKEESCFKNCSAAPTQISERLSTVRNVSLSPNKLSDSKYSNKNKNSSMFPSSENSDVTTTNLSYRALQIKKNMAQIGSALSEGNQASVSNSTSVEKTSIDKTVETSDSFHRDSAKEKNSISSTPVSKRLNSNRSELANTKTFSSNANPPFSNFKLPFPSPQPQDSRPSQSRRPLAENSDNFSGKMAMTASWIRNHQNLNLSQSEVEAETKLDINSKKKVDEVDEPLEDDTEEMEWTNAEPDNEIVPSNQDIVQTTSNVEQPVEIQKQADKLQYVCIVVDTNVFISGLSKISDIINMKVSGPLQPLLFIPWMVITELDFMKQDCSDNKLKQKVSNAIKFINMYLKEKNPRFVGQTVYDMEKQKLIGKSPDDKIMSCCLQATEKYKTVILLSNDLNLKSKAMINGITACSANEIIMKIVSKVTKNTKAQKVMQKMSILCSSVICECAKETYGDVWSKMDLLSSPPWSLVDCLKRFKKYWGSVFKEKLMKQFTKAVEDLLQLFNVNKYFADDSEDFISFMKLCVNLCIFLKDIEEFRGSVEKTLTEITKLG